MTFFSTSGKNGEYNAHDLVRRFAESVGAYWIPSLSTKDVGILSPEGREEVFCWFSFVKGCIAGETKLKDPAGVVVLDTYADASEDKDGLVEKVKKGYEDAGANVKVITLRDRDIKHCIACGSCYSTRECVLKDDYEKTVDEYYLGTDIITVVGKVDLGTLGVNYKGFVERFMQFGRAGEIHGAIMSYVCSGDEEPNYAEDLAYFRKHQSCIDLLSHEFLVGFFRPSELDIAVKQSISAYNADVMPGESGLAIGLDMQFAYLASFIRDLEPADYVDYQKRGFYDPVKPEPHARRINSPADAAASRKGRVVPFNMTLLDFDGKVKITERRPLKNEPITERRKRDAQAVLNGSSKPEKKGLFGWKK